MIFQQKGHHASSEWGSARFQWELQDNVAWFIRENKWRFSLETEINLRRYINCGHTFATLSHIWIQEIGMSWGLELSIRQVLLIILILMTYIYIHIYIYNINNRVLEKHLQRCCCWTYVQQFWIRNTTHYMMTSSTGNIFRVTGPLCGEFTGPRWWFETQSRSLWRHCNDLAACIEYHAFVIRLRQKE